MIERKTLLADFALLGVTVIWGGTFVTVKHLLASTPPLAILLWRFLVAFGVLLVFSRPKTFRVLFSGTLLGGALFLGYLFQTLGLLYVTPARSAFITGFCTLIVPIFALVILRTRLERTLPASIALALFGLFLLTSGDGEETSLSVGDFLTFLGAVAYALQIVLVEQFAKSNDAFALATVEMGAVALFSALSGALFGEERMLPQGFSAWGSIVFLGVVATGIAFTVQKVAQRYTSATHAGIVFVAEPVFAALFSYLLFGERLTGRGIAGCSLILLGILTTQLRLSPGVPSPRLLAQTQDPRGREGR
ncbi:DMT family transporter [Candidatus Caldatribacterium sp. SIUC1]|uniref:DMT family transporter n=1 Tax=Candidatus Caldatribacterium sp. SIUC1 TaxID=3418365 RepID=UPI003F6901C6